MGALTSSGNAVAQWRQAPRFQPGADGRIRPRVLHATVSFYDLSKWERLDRVDFVKLDAVGSEEDVLRGGYEMLNKYRPIIQLQATLIDVSVDLPRDTGFRAPAAREVLHPE